jgi:hypothetical protein
MTCPDPAAVEKCMLRFDDNDDHELQLDELQHAADQIGFFKGLLLATPAQYLERCDLDLSGGLTPSEFQSSLCTSTCEEQRVYIDSIC